MGFKTVVGAYGWLEDLFAEIDRHGPESAPDLITVDSGDGVVVARGQPLREGNAFGARAARR